MSFYRKYRPQKLAEIVGQEHVRRTFLNTLKKGGLTHAYIFSGTRGTGKTSTARIIARALNCVNPAQDGEPCNECDICADALTGRLIDLIEIDAASNRGIDEIRDLKEKIVFAPSRAKAKIYVIDEVHMLTKEAFNALLKTLEEPPEHAYFILATTEAHKVPETILSRCQRFDFHRIETGEIAKHLAKIAEQEEIKAETDALELIARQSAGGMRDAIGMLEQLGSGGEITTQLVAESLGLTRPQTVDDFVFALIFKKLNQALETINGLVAEGANLIQFNKSILVKLREQMLQKISDNKIAEAKKILKIIEEFTRAGDELKTATIPQLPLEIAAILVCEGAEEQGQKDKGSEQNAKCRMQNVETSKAKTNVSKEYPSLDKVDKKPAESKETLTKKLKGKLSVTTVKDVLSEVIGKLGKSFIKMSLKDCSVVKADNSEITLGFGSDFVLAKLDTAEIKNELIGVFSDVLGKDIKLKLERVEIKLASSAPEIEEPVQPQKKSLVEVAEELFGE